MAKHSHHQTVGWQSQNTMDASYSNYRLDSPMAPGVPGIPTLCYSPSQNSTNTYPQPQQRKDSCTEFD